MSFVVNSGDTSVSKLVFYISLSTALLAIITFSIAVVTPPLSGPFCPGDCFSYPFHDIQDRFPRDYLWMYPAILLSVFYLLMINCIHHFAPDKKKIYSRIGLLSAFFSSIILIINYYVQITFVQASLLAGETEGISILSQYNPHGLFIIFEEIGFSSMSFSFFCLIPVFSCSNILENLIRYLFMTGFLLVILFFILISYMFGVQREYRFEVAVITICWLQLIIAAILLLLLLKKKFKKS